MIDGFKNRAVTQERAYNAIDKLSPSDRIKYERDGFIMPETCTDPYCKICPRRTSRYMSRKLKIEEIINAEYWRTELDQEGIPITFYLSIDYGLVKMTRFNDMTALFSCTHEECNIDLYKSIIKRGYDTRMFGTYIQVDLAKEPENISEIEQKIINLKKLLEEN